jgi:glyoxylase-like metal-dependent hydrolase (beta-lactamase superfamily II)
MPPRAAFRASRLTPTTFLLVEHSDIYDEHPFLYAKPLPHARALCLLDTGCGGASADRTIELTSLRAFLETYAVADNGGRPLAAPGWTYVVVCSHVHYDHIRTSEPSYAHRALTRALVGVEDFAGEDVLASGADPAFLAPSALADHSLCADMGIRTPAYRPTLVAHRHAVRAAGAPAGWTVLHTPGHTPDSLAVWDEQERVLYVGDTLYTRAPILFPPHGSVARWFASVDALLRLVGDAPARLCAGHATAGDDARAVLRGAQAFMRDVLAGRERVVKRETKRGEPFVWFAQAGGQFSLGCPERLLADARREVPV